MLDRLTADDVQILKLEGPTICGHTCKTIVLEPTAAGTLPTVQQLREHVEARLDAAPRFRQRLVRTPLRIARPVWLDDPQFDIARHITALDAPPDEPLEDTVARLMRERLDRAHPLWHLDVLPKRADGTMVLVWRIHHCMADGTRAMGIASEVLWSSDPAPGADVCCTWAPCPQPSAALLFASGLRERAPRRRRSVRERHASPIGTRSALRREVSRTAEVTALAGRIGRGRQVAFARAPLRAIHDAGKRIDSNVTLNDVVLALVAGGVRSWLAHTAAPLEGIRVKVPVSLHHAGERERVANSDSYFIVDLPVDEPDPAARVLQVNRETRERKLDHDAETLYRLGLHPVFTHWAMSPRVFTFNVSNVRGPSTDVYVLGARVRELYSLAEIAHHHALRVSCISAGDSMFFGLCADRDAVRGLDVLADGIQRGVDELLTPSTV